MTMLFLIYWLFCIGWMLNELSESKNSFSWFEEFLAVMGSWALLPLCLGKEFSEHNMSNHIKK